MTDHLVVGGQLGNYLIDSVIGRGGMSVVYGAKHARLAMPVALKVLAPELSTDDTFRERFLREAQAAAAIDHPNVIPIHDMGLHEDSLYIVMRFVAGGDLKKLLADSGPLSAQRALKLLTPVALALDAAHAHGLIHRDVKPANVLIQRSAGGEVEHVYLTDFGIAKSVSSVGGLTRTGASIGTIGYMAPEQLEGGDVTAQTDIYALAATLYECITGKIPFERELAEGIRPPTGPLEPAGAVRPGVPAALDRAIAKALSHDPAERYDSCRRFLSECQAAVEGVPTEPVQAVGAGADAGLTATELSQAEPEPGGVGATAFVAASASASASSADAAAGDGARSAPPADAQPGPVAEPSRARGRRGGGRRWYLALVPALVAAAAVVVVLLTSGSSAPAGKLSMSALAAVPANHVTGSGQATVRLDGDKAAVTVTTTGLDDGAELVHLMHIHAGAKGICPPVSAARRHNGHLAISTNDGINYYGPPVQALTTRGDTSVSSILAFQRFPSGGALDYTRTITLPANVLDDIRRDNAVIVVHGTDYDGTGIYSGVLDTSELNKSVPATATAPALCGRLVRAQNAVVTGPRPPGSPSLYTASLLVNATAGASRGLFVCHAGAADGDVAQARRRADARGSSPSGASA